jgi:hypothetical protein
MEHRSKFSFSPWNSDCKCWHFQCHCFGERKAVQWLRTLMVDSEEPRLRPQAGCGSGPLSYHCVTWAPPVFPLIISACVSDILCDVFCLVTPVARAYLFTFIFIPLTWLHLVCVTLGWHLGSYEDGHAWAHLQSCNFGTCQDLSGVVWAAVWNCLYLLIIMCRPFVCLFELWDSQLLCEILAFCKTYLRQVLLSIQPYQRPSWTTSGPRLQC